MIATDFSPFGWDALVAIGTLTLALVTLGLVLLTRAMAKSSAADVRAQWRPVILPGDPPGVEPAIEYVAANQQLAIWVRNAGRGPALFVRVHLDPGGHSPEAWDLGALAPGQAAKLVFRGVLDLDPRQLLVDYRDLAGRLYSSAIVFEGAGRARRFYDVRLYEGLATTPLGDALPQPGLAQVGPASRPSLRRRLRGAWHGFFRGP